jgi:HSP20 family protein
MNRTLSVGKKPGSVANTPFRGLFARPMFEDLFNQFLVEGNGGPLSEVMNAAMDVAETDQAFEVKMDLPGVKAEDVDIQIDNNTLTVKGQRSEETEEQDEEKQYHRIERYAGSFSRSVVLPSSINEDETSAEFKDGVLHIFIPKTDDAKPRKIKIKR